MPGETIDKRNWWIVKAVVIAGIGQFQLRHKQGLANVSCGNSRDHTVSVVIKAGSRHSSNKINFQQVALTYENVPNLVPGYVSFRRVVDF